MNFSAIFTLIGLCLISTFFPLASWSFAKDFSHFSAELPEGWDGDEQSGFITDNKNEYLLTMGKKDEKGDQFLAQVSIFILPNKPGATSEQAARRLAEAQGDSTEPAQEGKFWVFEGEPRSRTIKGLAKTRVKANPEYLFIIICQDPLNLGGEEIISSLVPASDLARSLLEN